MRKLLQVAVCLGFAFAAASSLYAQDSLSCSLGKIKERVAPRYPLLSSGGRPPVGTVQIQATFAADGHVTGSRVISGPSALRFESEAFVRGWRAEQSSESRFCVITLDYRFDEPERRCNGNTRNISVREERIDETHVDLHVGCDW